MARPDPDPRAEGILLGWASRAFLWSATARTLLHAHSMGEPMLGIVAAHLCLSDVCLFLDGAPHVPADDIIRADCPVPPRAVRRLRDRLTPLRNEVLHLSEKSDDGRILETRWSAEPPEFTFRSSVGRGRVRWASITRAEIGDVLKLLDPWLERHIDRLVRQHDPVDHAAVARKIDAALQALVDRSGDDGSAAT